MMPFRNILAMAPLTSDHNPANQFSRFKHYYLFNNQKFQIEEGGSPNLDDAEKQVLYTNLVSISSFMV